MRLSILPALLVTGCAALQSSPTKDAESLAQAESAFAAQSVREDMRSAFLANFAPDGVYVRKTWVNAIEDLKARKAPPIVLDWRPVHTEVATSGELGYSTGPWKATSKTNPSEPPSYGQYVSIWKRDASGTWKVVVDIGVSNPKDSLWDAPLETIPGGKPVTWDQDAIDTQEGLFQLQSNFMSMAGAFRTYSSLPLRIYRDGMEPAVGREVAFYSKAIENELYIWKVDASEVAQSGEFGYARGHYSKWSDPFTILGSYLRVWRIDTDGHWRIIMDVQSPAS